MALFDTEDRKESFPMPEISVIIPCYNCVQTVGETISSVLTQKNSDYEIIAVDDGSTDDTLTVLRQLEVRYPERLHVYSQANAGVSAARNAGIRLSRGRHILFLDADDLLAQGLLEAVTGSLNRDPVDTVCFLYTYDEAKLLPIPEGCTAERTAVSGLLERLTFSKRDVVFCSFVYDRRILQEEDLWFVEGARYGEDWEFTTKYLAHCRTAGLLDRYGYFYRIVTGSVTRTVGYSQTDAIDAAKRTSRYLNACRHPFAETFGAYMYPRAVFSVAHRFGQARNRDLFQRLQREHDLKAVMGAMVRNPNVDIKSRLAAAAYLVSPRLYYLISIF